MKILCSLILSISLLFTNIDFSTIKQTFFSNERISQIYYNNELVWQQEPMYWIKEGAVQEGFPSKYATSTVTNAVSYSLLSDSLTGFEIFSPHETSAYCESVTAKVSTLGYRYMEIVYKLGGHGGLVYFNINGVDYSLSATDGVITVDIDDVEEVNIGIQCFSYPSGNHFHVNISSIKFY